MSRPGLPPPRFPAARAARGPGPSYSPLLHHPGETRRGLWHRSGGLRGPIDPVITGGPGPLSRAAPRARHRRGGARGRCSHRSALRGSTRCLVRRWPAGTASLGHRDPFELRGEPAGSFSSGRSRPMRHSTSVTSGLPVRSSMPRSAPSSGLQRPVPGSEQDHRREHTSLPALSADVRIVRTVLRPGRYPACRCRSTPEHTIA